MMGAVRGSAIEGDRRRLLASGIASILLWGVALPLLSFLRYEGPAMEPTMNPMYVELAEPASPPPKPAAKPVSKQPETPKVEIAEKARAEQSPATASPSASSRTAAAPAAARAAANVHPDPSAAPMPTGAASPSSYQTRSDSLQPLSEAPLKSRTPSPGAEPSPLPKSAVPGTAAESSSADPSASRSDALNRALGAASSSLASAPGSGGAPGGTGSAASGTSSGAKTGGGDLFGGFDFGAGPARELWSSRRVKVPDRLLAGLPNELATRVSFVIEGGGTVLESSIAFDPPLPDKVEAFLRAAFSSWQFSPADSDGQVVFRYSIKVR